MGYILLCFLLPACQGIASETSNSSQKIKNYLLIGSTQESLYSIYRVNPDGTDLQLLTSYSDKHQWQWLSPNERYFALLEQWDDESKLLHRLKVIDLETLEQVAQIGEVGRMDKQIGYSLADKYSVIWSDASDKLIFERNAEDDPSLTDVWLYDLKTNESMRLLSQAREISEFVLSPDGKHLAVIVRRICQLCQDDSPLWDVAVIQIEEPHNQTWITDFEQALLGQNTTTDPYLCQLSWSPSSQYLFFQKGCARIPTTLVPTQLFLADMYKLGSTEVQDISSLLTLDTFAHEYTYHWENNEDILYISYTFGEHFYSPSTLAFSEVTGFASIQVPSLKVEHTSQITNSYYVSWNPQNQHHLLLTLAEYVPRKITGPTHLISLNDGDITISSFSSKLPYSSCDIKQVVWNTTGQYVAYISQLSTDLFCSPDDPPTQAVTIIDVESQLIVNVPFEDNRYEILGWLEIP